jgi:hypothetical protein
VVVSPGALTIAANTATAINTTTANPATVNFAHSQIAWLSQSSLSKQVIEALMVLRYWLKAADII